jgi:hypothetical protein
VLDVSTRILRTVLMGGLVRPGAVEVELDHLAIEEDRSQRLLCFEPLRGRREASAGIAVDRRERSWTTAAARRRSG